MTTHTGTHVECQAHWDYEGTPIDKYPIDYFAGNAKVIRFNSKGQDYFKIDAADLIESGAEKLEPGDICIIDTKWDTQLENERYCMASPYFTVEAAKYLAEKKVKLVASDFPMCGDPRDGMDFVPEGTALPDTVFFDHNIPILMGLVGLEKIPDEVFFVGLPLKIEGTDGAPARAIAIEF